MFHVPARDDALIFAKKAPQSATIVPGALQMLKNVKIAHF